MTPKPNIILFFESLNLDDENSLSKVLDFMCENYPHSFREFYFRNQHYYRTLDKELYDQIGSALLTHCIKDQRKWRKQIDEKIRNIDDIVEMKKLDFELKEFFQNSEGKSLFYYTDEVQAWFHIDDKRVIREDEQVYNNISNKLEYLETYNKYQKEHESFIEPTPNKLKTDSHWIAFLDELGIIEHLKTKFPELRTNRPQFARLIKCIVPIKKKNDSVRDDLKDLDNNPERIKTDPAMNEVRRILSDLHLFVNEE